MSEPWSATAGSSRRRRKLAALSDDAAHVIARRRRTEVRRRAGHDRWVELPGVQFPKWAQKAREQELRRAWRSALPVSIAWRVVAGAAWCVVAGVSASGGLALTDPVAFEQPGTIQAHMLAYVPTTLAAAVMSFGAEAILLRRRWTNGIFALVAGILGLRGMFTAEGTFAGLPDAVPLYYVGGGVAALLLGWLMDRVGTTPLAGTPLEVATVGGSPDAWVRRLLHAARLGGAVAGGIGLTAWLLIIVPLPGGAGSLIVGSGFLIAPTAWLTEAIPVVDPLGLSVNVVGLAMVGLAGFLLAALSGYLHRLAPPLIWVSVVGAVFAGLLTFFAVPWLVSLALIPAVASLLAIRASERTADGRTR